MAFTLSTFPLLALSVILCYRAKWQLLPVVMFMSIFQAASIMNLGGGQIGIQPAYFLLLLAIGQKLLSRKRKGEHFGIPPRQATIPLGLFVLYATVSAFVNPILFHGVFVTNAKFGDTSVPLAWETGHLNQLFYLLLAFVLYLLAAYKTTPSELAKAMEWFIGGCVFAAVVSVYQYLCLNTGLPFPTEYLHTNPTFVMFQGYEINGFARVDSTFTEAASAAFSFIVSLALVFYRLASGSVSVRNVTQCALIMTGLFLTISTTAYVCFAYLLTIAGAIYIFRWKPHSGSRLSKVLLCVPLLALIAAVIAIDPLRESVTGLIHTVVLDKSDTTSYRDRTKMNEDAFATASDTYWLGAGWGECRASSFIPTLVANVGLPGALLFFVFCGNVFLPVLTPSSLRLSVHGAVLFSLSALLLVLIVSAPEIGHPIIWLFFAVAAKLRHSKAQRPQRITPDQVVMSRPQEEPALRVLPGS